MVEKRCLKDFILYSISVNYMFNQSFHLSSLLINLGSYSLFVYLYNIKSSLHSQ